MLLEQAATDWLNTKPVFYNEKTGAISHNMNEVIDYSDFSFDAEGLRNYLQFGYSVFGQTMVSNVKFLDHSSHIAKQPDGSLKIWQDEDVAEKLWNPGQTNGTEVFEKMIDTTRKWAEGIDETIILPLSGGLDSRLLTYSLMNQDKVNAYTYGLSARQRDSFEAVKAHQTASMCGINWEQIELDKYLSEEYLSQWFELYGPAVHLHGMYQLEFYKKIKSRYSTDNLTLLSGIIGDVFAGTVRVNDIHSAHELTNLGYLHGICIEDDICTLSGKTNYIAEEYYEKNKDKIADKNWCVLLTLRLKLMLLSYLLKTPQSLGMNTWSPFIIPEISMGMLNLDWSLKNDRVWQQREFDKLNMNFGWEKGKCDYNMVLDIETLRKNPVRPLDVKLLGRVVDEKYVQQVNEYILKKPLRTLPAKPRTPQNIYNKLIRQYNGQIEKALVRYEILGSIERLLINYEKLQ